MGKSLVFVNYEHPSHIKDRSRRRIVSTHTGKCSQEAPKRPLATTQYQSTLQSRGLATTPNPSYSHPLIPHPALQPAQTPPPDLVRPPQRPTGRHGLIVREKRRCIFNWRFREYRPRNMSSAPANTEWEPYYPPISLESIQLTTGRKDDDAVPERLSGTVRSFARPPSPLSLVGQGRVDPFAKYAVDEDHTYLSEIIDHGVHHFWPMIAPSKDLGLQPACRSYLEDMAESPMAYYAYQLSLTANLDWTHDNHPRKEIYKKLRLKHTYHAIRAVREHLETLKGPPSDRLILVTLILATVPNGDILSRSALPVSRFRSPLADAQILDTYGYISSHPSHWAAFYKLVEMRGGLGAIAGQATAGMYQLGDLVRSSRESTPPGFPYYSFFADISQLDLDRDRVAIDGELASSLLSINHPVFTITDLRIAIKAVARATTTLGDYYKNKSPPTFLLLLELRNWAQWLSLNLQTAASIESNVVGMSQEGWCLFEIVRLALLTYNNLVIYPLSPTNAVGIRLALKLRTVLEASIKDFPVLWTIYPKLFLWTLLLGGISDAAETERGWYKAQFHRLALSPAVFMLHWHEVERCFISFLWQSDVLNVEAIKFWNECTKNSVIQGVGKASAA